MLARLATSLREFRRPSILAPCFVGLEVVMDVIIPYLMARIIDTGIAASDMRHIQIIGIMLVICAVLSLIFGVTAGRFAAIASSGFARNLRRDMYYTIQTFSFTNIDTFSTASLVTRLTTDITNVQNAYQMLLRILFRSPLMLVFSLIMAFRVNTMVSMTFLAVVPVLGIGLYFIVTRAHPIFERVIRIYDRMNTVVRENLRGIRVVKAFVREDFEIQKFDQVSDDIYQGFSRAEKLLAFNSPLMQFCMYSCTLLLSWLGARMIVAGGMTTGQLMGLITYATQILMSLMMLSVVLTMVTVSRASAERIVEVLNTKTELHNNDKPITDMPDGSISFRNVLFGYGDCNETMCLRDINLDIRAGETIGIVGGTGSGKSTLVQLIPRLYDVAEGSVMVGGTDVRSYDLDTLRDKVAMVLQKNVLFSGTIRSNLQWGNTDATDEQMIEALRLAQAEEFVMALPDKLGARVEQGGSNFSGGQRQRLCIARALLKQPKILILDDSTSAIDSKTDEKIRQAFRDVLPGVTKIIIAQRIASIMQSDRIIVMDEGRINGFASHDELLRTNTIYQEVYTSQMKQGEEHGAA